MNSSWDDHMGIYGRPTVHPKSDYSPSTVGQSWFVLRLRNSWQFWKTATPAIPTNWLLVADRWYHNTSRTIRYLGCGQDGHVIKCWYIFQCRKFGKKTGRTFKLLLRFMVISDVYRSFIPNYTTFIKYCLTPRISKLPESKFYGPGGHNGRSCLQSRANFHWYWALQIVLIIEIVISPQ